MPSVDVSRVLLSSSVAAMRFDVVRREQEVDDNGIVSVKESWIRGLIGALFNTGDNSLLRQEDYQNQNQTITVVTKFRLRPSSINELNVNWQPDLVHFNKNFYQVKTLEDFTRFGAGFVVCECSSQPFNGTPPDNTSQSFGSADFRVPGNPLGGGPGRAS